MKEKNGVILISIIFIILSTLIFKIGKDEIKNEFQHNFNFPFYKENKKDEYLSYKETRGLSLKEAIIEVNIGLNHPFYETTYPALNKDKITMLVNKYHYISKDYVPNNLIEINGLIINKEAYEAYINMKNDIQKENMNIRIISAYRSYDYQEKLYNNYLKYESQKVVDTYSARPGYSEHHTGLAIDIDNGVVNFNKFYLTKEFNWMQNNAYKYGFILRYPEGKERITGYKYEPWHYRYVGKDIALNIKKNNSTYEEYYYEFIDK